MPPSSQARSRKPIEDIVYQELRHLAHGLLRGERDDHTLRTGDLVHEAWLRLGERTDETIRDRRVYYYRAARAMRQVLIDHARRRNTAKRGGGRTQVVYDAELPPLQVDDREFLELNEALDRLIERNRRLGEMVLLRYYAGLSKREIAECFGVTERTITNWWDRAREMLAREMR